MAGRALLTFAVCAVVITAVYHRVPSNFLRAESGSYLISSHADAQTRRAAAKELVRYSFNGHYTPLAFLAEFQAARFIGTNGTLWRARQILALAIATAGVFAFSRAAAARLGASAAAATAVGVAISASVAFQTAMFDFISWPFMVLQLLWIACAALVMHALVRFACAPTEKRWLLIAASAAYGSAHISGLGLVLVGATAVVMGGVLLIVHRDHSAGARSSVRLTATVVALVVVLTAFHVWLTLRLDYAPRPAADGQLAPERLQMLLGFLWQFAVAGVTSFFPTAVATPSGRTAAHLWPFGIALLLGSACAIALAWRRAARLRGERAMTAFALHGFSIGAFWVLATLVLLRVRVTGLADLGNELANFTWGPRYIIPLHTTLLGAAIAGAAFIAKRAPRGAAAALYAFAIAAAIAQLSFQRTSAKHLLPQTMISHDAAWQLVLETVRECRAQQLPAPDVPLAPLAQEFADTTLRSVEPLVRYDLGLRPDEPLATIPWAEYADGDRERYRAVPALKRLQRKLGLLPSKKT
jgi:hypothetical protein